MTSYFNAWINYQGLHGPKRCITAFVAGMMASGGLVPMISNWIHAVIG
jgi:hypothetical protein